MQNNLSKAKWLHYADKKNKHSILEQNVCMHYMLCLLSKLNKFKPPIKISGLILLAPRPPPRSTQIGHKLKTIERPDPHGL